jgi:hypothetical protein
MKNRKDLERLNSALLKIKNPNLTEAQRRKAAQDEAMGDVEIKGKGLKGAVEKFKTRNDLVSYTYENDKGGTTGVTTTKKKVRKEQRKIDKTNKEKPAASSKSPKTKKVKSYKAPKSKNKGIYLDGKGNFLSSNKSKRRKKKLKR